MDAEKMKSLAEMLKNEIPGCGFALIVLQPDGSNVVNYISNVQDEFMINALDIQIDELRKRKT